MKKNIIRITFVILLFLTAGAVHAPGAEPVTSGSMDVKQDGTNSNREPLQLMVSGIEISGGVSAGYFYASNPGEEISDDAFLLSNFLVEVSSSDDSLPVGFSGAFGDTSTPSVLDTPENSSDFEIEYASLTLKTSAGMSLEAGLLQPNAGFENTYTFNNKNVILGAIASQQPYNAYGARIAYDVENLSLWCGYFEERLDEEEYNSPDYAWEIGISAPIQGSTFTLYHYNIKGQRNLYGAVIEKSITDVDFAFNIDYWRWNGLMKDFLYGSKSSIGGAFYICPNFGSFSVPLRFEYINQKNSSMYIDSPGTKHIYSVTVSPTWYFNEYSYIRAEWAYVRAGSAFADEEGRTKDDRINSAVELGFLF